MKHPNEEIFKQAYNEYRLALLKRTSSKISDPDLGDDLVQITFMKTWEYLLKHGKVDSMKAFLFHVLNNLIIDEYRKQKAVSLDTLTEGGFQIVVDDRERLYNTLDGKNAMSYIPLLSDKYRDVVSMRYVDDLSLTEIAKIQRQSKNTVAVQIHRGVEKLATFFGADVGAQTYSNV